MPILNLEFWVPSPIDKVWEIYRYPKNLEKISPAYAGVHVLGDPITEDGALVEIQLRPSWLPFTLNWSSRVQNVVAEGPQRQFVDVMEKGLFSSWKHTHKLESGDEMFRSSSGQDIKSHQPGTWIIDQVEYELPLGPFNSLANQLLVKRALGSMFSERKKAFQEMF
ncbi:MAG: SRPBCC family protein [Proteobacteria bacterium]|nr:SRPBCC family protein [Pseudomonadota bacterium]